MTRLPLTPVERYFYHDHRGSHPAWIRYEFTFRGALERAAFARAWGRMEERHPLTGATVSRRTWGGPVWNLGAARPEWAWLGTEENADDDDRDLHDLSTRAGLRGVVRVRGAETQLTMLVHHAVADGLGLLLIAEDFFTLYAVECGAGIALPAAVPLTARRDRSSLRGAEGWRELPWILIGVLWGVVLGRQRVVEMRGSGRGFGRRELAARSWSPRETMQLRKAARTAGASLHELLVRDAQAALNAWLARHARAQPDMWTRFLVPVYLGGARSEPRSSAPALGVALIERRVRSLGRRARLLQRAHEDMEFIRARGLARAFRMSMLLRGWLPGQIARYCRRAGARSTLVLSNLGKVFARGPLVGPDGGLKVPGAELTNFAGWGPCRPGTSVFVATGIYRGAQSIWTSYDPGAMSASEAEDFAGELEGQLRRSLAGE